jgi:hypothetical protein
VLDLDIRQGLGELDPKVVQIEEPLLRIGGAGASRSSGE